MRILSVCAGLGIGGTERVAQNFSLGYVERGHEVAFLNYGAVGTRQKVLEGTGIPVYNAESGFENAIGSAVAFNPDVVHFHRCGWENARETHILERLHRKGRCILEQNVFGEPDYSTAAGMIDVHLLLSGWCMWRWRRLLGDRRSLAVGAVVPNPVNPRDFSRADIGAIEEFRSKYGIGREAYVYGRVGQPYYGKWHPQLFLSFAEMLQMEPNAYLMVRGMPGGLKIKLGALSSGVRERIIELPLTESDEELSIFYSSLDCFAHAAIQGESFGLVLAEAMMCGCPVVTLSRPHRDNSQLEVVGHMRGGLVAGSVKDFSAALKRLWADSDLRQSISMNAREHVLTRFDKEVVIPRVLHIAEIALASDGREALTKQLSGDKSIQTEVDSAYIRSLYMNVIGKPSKGDLVKMYLLHRPFINKAKKRVKRLIKRETIT
jgi:glycosyltransferase involved in cell wall biosynthesis